MANQKFTTTVEHLDLPEDVFISCDVTSCGQRAVHEITFVMSDEPIPWLRFFYFCEICKNNNPLVSFIEEPNHDHKKE